MTKRATTSRKAPARKPAPVEAPPANGARQTILIGAIVVAVLLVMCCCLTLLVAWFFGDSIVNGLSSSIRLVVGV
jgi:hypothetical protein